MCAGLCPTYATALDAAEENRNGRRLSCSRRYPRNWYYVSEICGRKISKWWKIRNFFEVFGPPCRNVLVDLDGSTPECAQVCVVHIGLHLASEKNRNGSCPMHEWDHSPIFWVFNSLSPRPTGADWHHRGRGHVGRHCPYINNICCGSVQALLRYRSKTADMQKFPFDSHSNEKFISPFSARRGRQPPKGEKTHSELEYTWIGPRIVEKTLTKNEQNSKSKTNTSPFALTSEWRVIK